MSSAKTYIETLRKEIEESARTRLGKDSVNMLNTVSESVFSRSAHFILELLQNAEDSGPKVSSASGSIEFRISSERIRITHNGLPFQEQNVDAICGVRSTKKPEQGSLGFLGIGFKSVFKITDCPHIHSGAFHFKFDKAGHADAASVPWQIMPIWIDGADHDVNSTHTTFDLPFRSPTFFEQTREELKKLDVHVFLFLKWLRKVVVIDELTGEQIAIENYGEQDGIITFRKAQQEKRFVAIHRPVRVPAVVASDPSLTFYKRQNVTQREVVIAFEVNESGDLTPVDDASALGSVSSFLPLIEERSGAKFLIQADFLVQPGREAIQYELAWNRWLVDEAVEAAKEAIAKFKAHPRWWKQFLPLFSFTSHVGQPAFDKLFGPRLSVPLLRFLVDSEVIPTASHGFVRPAVAIHVEGSLKSLLSDGDLPLLFPGRTDLRMVDPSVNIDSFPAELKSAIRRVEYGPVARSQAVLKTRLGQPEWFAMLFQGMAESRRDFRVVQRQGRRGRIEWVEDPIYVLTDRNELTTAKDAYLRGVPSEILELRATYPAVDALMRTYKLLHSSLESDDLNSFFKERTHVQAIDYDKVCREVFLPKVKATAQPPLDQELIAYTRLLQKGPGVHEVIWVLTVRGAKRPSDQVFMGVDYSPAENWQTNAEYVPELDFLDPVYLDGVPVDERGRWKEFLKKVGLKERGENNHVERFAMSFVEDKLASELTDFIATDRVRVGYDREATRRDTGALVRIEIKGQKKEGPVRLDGNEPQAARSAQSAGEPFWVCIVAGVPEVPQLWVVEEPLKAGSFDVLTIDVTQWRNYGRRV